MTRSGKKRQKKGEEKPGVAEGTRVRISKILEDFRVMNTDVYVFDENLTNHERAVVHELCRKMGMASKSSGRGSQRRVSVYKSKKKKDKKKGKESLTSFTFTEVARDALQELFSHYPPSEGERHEEMDGKHTGKDDKINIKKDDIFFKPLMSRTDIVKRLESLASKIEREPKLRQISVERSKLPIASFRDTITSTIEAHQVVLISGETGCGKTTQVPQYLLDSMWAKGEACKIICTQPRRISATSVSERISFERGENVGHDVGYKIRLESKGGRHSSVVFCTNGILLRVLISKGAGRQKKEATNKHEKVDLSHITHIIVKNEFFRNDCPSRTSILLALRIKFENLIVPPQLQRAQIYKDNPDEIHERDRYSDFMLAIIRDMLPSCPHLRLILMSATLDADRFSHYFGGCPIIRVPGFTYPVKTFYLEDVLSFLKSAKNNHLDSASDFQIDNHDLTEEYKIALDEAITLAWSNDELDPLLDLVSSEGTPKMFNYRHSSTGLTPLMVFAGKGSVADVCKLLSCGADCSLRDNDGLTAFELAEKENQGETAEIIKEHMENVHSNSLEEQQLLDKYLAAINPEQVDIVLIEQLLRKICADSEDGAILIFLPGWDDINKTRERLLAAPYFRDSSKFWILSLHSMVPSAEQKKVFKRAPPGCHKIILSTNIAETAVTIDDVVYVIDGGRMKEKSYDPYDNVSTLQSSWISKASAKQREGRAGRCQPGICYHLYSKFRASSLPEFQVPEIKRMPIEELCLQVKLMDPNCKIEAFLRKTLDPPIFETIRNGIIVLQDIGALSLDEKLTELGEKLGVLPVHPLISKMLFLAILLNCLDPALTLACAADSRNPFTLPMLPNDRKRADAAKLELASLYGGNSDQLAVIAAFECWKSAKETGQEAQFCSQYFVSSTTMHMLSGLRKQLQNELLRNGFIPNDVSSCNINARDPGILHAVLVAGLYPMVGRFLTPLKNRKHSAMIETAGGNKVRMHPHSINFKWTFKKYDVCPLIMYDEITRGDGGMHIRHCSIVGPLPLLLFAIELAVAPLNGNDNVEEEEGDSDEADEDEDEDDEMVEDGKGLNKSSKQPGERIMSSPDNTVMVIIDRWLPFELTALDIAQIYCLRERLSAAILFKVTNPRRVLPAVLGASVYAVSSILSYDGLSGISSLGSVPSVPSMSDATGLEESAPEKRSAINKENNFLKSLMNRTSCQYRHKNSSETSSQFSNGAVYFDGSLSNHPSAPYQAASSKSHHLPPHPVDMPHQSPPSPVVTRSQQGVRSSSVGKQVKPKFPPHTNGRKERQRSVPSVVTNQQLAPPTPPEDADMNRHQRAASKVGLKPQKQSEQMQKPYLVGYGAGTFGPYGLRGDSFKRHRGAGFL